MLFLIGSTAMTVPIFFMPLIKQYGWSHARTSLLPTVFVLLLGGAAPIAGWLLDRVQARVVMGTGAAMIAAGLLWASQTHSFWGMLGAWLLMGAGGAGSTVVPCAVVAANWFADNRGLAIGATLSGSGTGGIVLPPLTDYLIRRYSIGTAFFVLAVPVIVIVLPMILLEIRTRPAGAVKSSVAEEVAKLPGLELRPALGTAPFWLLGLVQVDRQRGFGGLLLSYRALSDSHGLLLRRRRAPTGRHNRGRRAWKPAAGNHRGPIHRPQSAAVCLDLDGGVAAVADRRGPCAGLAGVLGGLCDGLRDDRGRDQLGGACGDGRDLGAAPVWLHFGPDRPGGDVRAERRHGAGHLELLGGVRTGGGLYDCGRARRLPGSGGAMSRGDPGVGDVARALSPMRPRLPFSNPTARSRSRLGWRVA